LLIYNITYSKLAKKKKSYFYLWGYGK
jgi:hypothetical protein